MTLQTHLTAAAVAAFAAAHRRFPDSADACLGMALALRRFYGFEHDFEWLERAVVADPGHVASWRAYALTLERAGRLGESLAAWRRLLALAPDDAEGWLWLGETLAKDGNPVAAREAWAAAEARGTAFSPWSEAARWARERLAGE